MLLQWFFVHDWNRFIHICGKSARLEWIEPARTRDKRFQDPDALFAAPFREIRRWPWKQNESVRLYELERP